MGCCSCPAVVALAIVVALDRATALEAVANSVGVVDPATRTLSAMVPVGNAPTEVAASDDWVWVLNANDGTGTISRLAAGTRERVSTFSVGGTPRAIAAAFGSLWVGTTEGRVFRIDPSSDLVDTSWTLPNAGAATVFANDQGAGWLAVGASAVWAGSTRAISRIDPVTDRLRPHTSRVWGPMAYGFGSLWVLGSELERLSPETMRPEAVVELAGGFVRVAAGLGSVWVTDDENGRVLRIDPLENGISQTYQVGGSPFGIAIGRDAVWVAVDDGTAARIDPPTGDVTLTSVGGAPRGIAIGRGAVWVSVN